MNKSVVDVLKGVRTRLTTPERWTKGENARDSSGNAVFPWISAASRWCVDGAVQAEAHPDHDVYLKALAALNNACRGKGSLSVFEWQDHPSRTHADVLALIDQVIQHTEATR